MAAAMFQSNIEKLVGRDNYNTWKFAVKTYLEHEELWEGVDPDSKVKPSDKDDVKARSKIILLIDPVNYIHVQEAKSAREVWINLQNAFEDSGLSRKVGLLRDLINTSLDSCSNVEEYVNKILSTAHKLRNIGFSVDDEWLGTLMLSGLPDTYKPMIMGLESSGVKISADSIKTKLLQEVKVSESSAFYTKPKNNNPSAHQQQHTYKSKGKGPRCYNCNKHGHFSNQCHFKKKAEKDANKENVFSAVFSACNSVEVDNDAWYIDSGASVHMSRRLDWMYETQNPPMQSVRVANNQTVSVEKIGKLNISTSVNQDVYHIQVTNVLYVPNLSTNLLSVRQLTKKGFNIQFTDDDCLIFNSENKLIATAKSVNNMYKLNTISENVFAVASDSSKNSEIWHRRMGHLNYADVNKLVSCTKGVELSKNFEKPMCKSCIEGKQTRYPFKNIGSRAKSLLEVVHSDLCGPMETQSMGGAKYFITFIDDFSRKVFVYFLKNKIDIKTIFERFKTEVENQLDSKIKILRSDNGTEYCNHIFLKFLSDSGIKHQTSSPYTPEQNGLAERMNRSLVERAKCMLFDAKLPKLYWAEAVSTAAYIINRSPTRVLSDITPEEKWTGNPPNISHMKIFGSKAMVHVPKEKRLKWDRKSKEMIFLGYCENTKGYRLFDPKSKKIIKSRDVIFMEECDHNTNDISEHSQSIPPESVDLISDTPTSQNIEQDDVQNVTAATDSSFDSCSTVDDRDSTYQPSTSDSCTSTPERNIILRSRQITRKYDGENHVSNFICMSQIEDPMTVEEAMTSAESKHWKEAMDEEFKSLMSNNTWDLVDLPPGKKPIPCKWVFKTKTDEEGNIAKYKARLVIKGCAQKKGIDYNEVFSPVIRLSSLRYLFALAVKYDLDIDQMDAISAFLQGDIDEEIYMVQPAMYENSTKVCKLKRSLYGLKQASRQWNKKLDATLKEIGLTRSRLDPCIYYRITNERNILFMAIYVDDLVLFTNDKSTKEYVKQRLCEKFKMKDLGELKYCLGLYMTRDRQKGILQIDQKKYIKEILHKYGMNDCKTVKNPADLNIKFQSTDDAIVENIPYQEIIGCLLYLSQCTRPDISFIVNLLSKYNNKPQMQHWCAVKRVMRYLKGTMEYKLTYEQSSEEKMIHGFCDADWASSEDDRRSCTGYAFLFQGGAISWNSKRQPTVALSTTEAEYMSLSSCTQEAMWLRQLQEELWPQLKNETMVIFCDNQSCIKLSGTDSYHSRSKHIDVRHHFIRDKVNEKKIEVQYIQTGEMVADALTKSTPHTKFVFCLTKMGLFANSV